MTTLLRPHPKPPASIATVLDGVDGLTDSQRQHRALSEPSNARHQTIAVLRSMLVQHHSSPQKQQRFLEMNEALKRQGLPPQSLYPAHLDTKKGNLAEIVLAEYIVANEGVTLPIYRLRYNPNIHQSMKGDDVLAFDLDSSPQRIIVGEAKFRGTPAKQAVVDIVDSLLASHRAKVPASLQFVVDRLYEAQQNELAAKVQACTFAILRGELQMDYVGLLLTDKSAAKVVNTHTPAGEPHRLAMISLGVDDPVGLVDTSFDGLS